MNQEISPRALLQNFAKEICTYRFMDRKCLTGLVTSTFLLFLQSAFPTKLSLGLPKRHHIVCYIHAKLKTLSSQALSDRLHLDPEEVGACAWIDAELAHDIVAADEESQMSDRSCETTVRPLEFVTRTLRSFEQRTLSCCFSDCLSSKKTERAAVNRWMREFSRRCLTSLTATQNE